MHVCAPYRVTPPHRLRLGHCFWPQPPPLGLPPLCATHAHCCPLHAPPPCCPHACHQGMPQRTPLAGHGLRANWHDHQRQPDHTSAIATHRQGSTSPRRRAGERSPALLDRYLSGDTCQRTNPFCVRPTSTTPISAWAANGRRPCCGLPHGCKGSCRPARLHCAVGVAQQLPPKARRAAVPIWALLTTVPHAATSRREAAASETAPGRHRQHRHRCNGLRRPLAAARSPPLADWALNVAGGEAECRACTVYCVRPMWAVPAPKPAGSGGACAC